MRELSGAGPYEPLVAGWERLAKRDGMLAHPRVIADAIMRAATARRPRTRYVAPFAGRVMLRLRWLLSDRAFDWLFGKMFGIPARLGA